MKLVSHFPRIAMALILLVLAGAISSCAEPVAPLSPGGAVETAVLVPSSKGAIAASYAIEAATIETRYWDSSPWYSNCGGYACWQPGFPGKSDPAGYFNALPRTAAGYTNRPVALPTLTCASMTPGTPSSAAQYSDCINNPGDGTTASHTSVATRYRLLINSSTDLAIRFGVDFMGGVMMVGDAIVAQNWDDPAWWGFFDTDVAPCGVTRCDKPIWVSDPWGTIVAKIPSGVHEVVVIGFENGADYGAGVQIAGADSVWRDVTSKHMTRTLSLAVNVGGRIAGSNGVTCLAGSCTAALGWGTMPALTAVPDTYFALDTWGGVCSGTGVCEPQMDTDQSVTATFKRVQWPLQVYRAGAGQGTVASADSVINCGTACLAGFPVNGNVVLTAAADANSSVFTGWSGAGCPGTGPCTVPMSQAQTVTATFALKRFGLSVTTFGTGTVTSSSGGINCGTACGAEFDFGTAVTLTATAGSGSTFAGWAGACSGTGTCVVTMTQARAVTATFNLTLPPPPPVSSCEATPSVLWPPNHKMVTIDIKPLPGFTLKSVTSSEPDDAPDGGAPGDDAAGDGATVNDVQGWVLEQPSFSGKLRAERDGRGTGRTYSFVYANGAATATCTVTVPHDKR